MSAIIEQIMADHAAFKSSSAMVISKTAGNKFAMSFHGESLQELVYMVHCLQKAVNDHISKTEALQMLTEKADMKGPHQ